MGKILHTGVSSSFHFDEIEKVKTGISTETRGVWFEIESGLVNVTMFFRSENRQVNKAIDKAVNVLDEIKAQLEEKRVK